MSDDIDLELGNEMPTYEIVRFYKEEDKPSEVIQSGLTLEEAKEHCNLDDTKQEGEWFDGWRIEG